MNARLLLAASLLAGLCAAGPARAEEAARPAPKAAQAEEVVDFDPELDPPRGSEPELKLWKAGRQISFDVSSSRREASRLQREVRGQALIRRLGEAAAAETGEAAARLLALQKRLDAGWVDNYTLFSRRWPVDPIRACNYPWLNYDSALRAKADGSKNADLTTTRGNLEKCVASAKAAVDPMRASNAAFAAVIAEATQALAAKAAPAAPAAKKAKEGHEAHEAHEAKERAAGHDEERHHGAKRD